MAGMNKNSFELTGNVGKEGGKFYPGSESKKDMGMVSVAHNNGYRNEHGEWQNTRTDWLTIKAFGSLASVIADLQKGDRVLATGKLSSNNWTDRNGRKHYDIDLIADSVQLITTVPQAGALEADDIDDDGADNDTAYDGLEADDVPLSRPAAAPATPRRRSSASSATTTPKTPSATGTRAAPVRTGIRSRDGVPVPQPQVERETQRRSVATTTTAASRRASNNTRRTA